MLYCNTNQPKLFSIAWHHMHFFLPKGSVQARKTFDRLQHTVYDSDCFTLFQTLIGQACSDPGFKLNQLCILPRSINFCYKMICEFLLYTFYPSISFANASVFFPFLSLQAACSSGEWLALSVSCQVNSFGEGLQENTGNCGKLFFSVGTYHLQIEEKIPCHEICALSPSTIRDTAVDCVSLQNFLTSRYVLWQLFSRIVGHVSRKKEKHLFCDKKAKHFFTLLSRGKEEIF